MTSQLQRLKQALQTHRKALEELENALLEFEETLPRRIAEYPDDPSLALLSIEQVSKTLGMGKSWTYRRLKNGEIPSVKLGRSIKVKRSDLEEYLENRRYRPPTRE